MFTKWLLDQIAEKGWTQAELARRAGITPGAISHVINEERKPGEEFCRAIARALHIPPETVFRAAGLLPPDPDKPPDLLEWIHIYTEASPDDREIMLEQARFWSQRKIVVPRDSKA